MTEPLLSLALFALIATGGPGGATTLATATGARFGVARSLPLILGIAAGLAALSAAAAAGLAAALRARPGLEFALTLAGTLYLLRLAWRIGRAGAPAGAGGEPERPPGFTAGALLLLLNPKGWAVAMSAAASSSALSPSPFELAATLGGALALAATATLTLWAAGGVLLGRVLRSERQWRRLNALLGALLALSVLPLWAPRLMGS